MDTGTTTKENKIGRTLLHVIIFCLLLVVIIVGVDWYVDSFYSFRLTYNELAEMQLSGGVAIAKDIDGSERKRKLACIEQMEPVDCIVLGSSRSMFFTQEDFPGKTFYNLSVSGGQGINDYLAAVYWLDYYDKLPSEILMEVSPAIFNGSFGDTQYLEWGDASDYMRAQLDGVTITNPKEVNLGIVWKDILSPSYFRANFEHLRRGRRTYAEPVSQDIYDTYYIYYPDGSWMYSTETFTQYTREMIAEETAKVATVHDIYLCGDYYSLDADMMSEFEKLMSYLEEKGVTVSFYLPPYSPMLYEHIAEDETCEVILQVEKYILQYAKDRELIVYGSYDPTGSEISMEDFFDPYHLWKDSIMQTLWQR